GAEVGHVAVGIPTEPDHRHAGYVHVAHRRLLAPRGAEIEGNHVVALTVLLADAGRHLDGHAEAQPRGIRLDVDEIAAHGDAFREIYHAHEVQHGNTRHRLVDDRPDPERARARQPHLLERARRGALRA